MSARGNGGTYHYYACTGRQKLGRAGCDGERIPRDKLESAVLKQLASLYRDGALVRRAVNEAAAEQQADRPELEERRRSLASPTAPTSKPSPTGSSAPSLRPTQGRRKPYSDC